MSLLDKIPHISVRTDVETIDLYRLGVFDNSMFELVELKAEQFYPPHIHHKSDAHLYMIIGEGKIILDGKEIEYKSQMNFRVDRGVSHGFRVRTDTLFLSINTPPIIDKHGNVDITYLE